jgi:cytochrome P450
MIHVLAVTGIFWMFWISLSVIRTLYLHPLCNLPGPNLWIAFPIFRYISLVRGRLDTDLRAFHNKYGVVVRFGPDEVSFITTQAWGDIYTHCHGNRQLPKVLHSTSNPSDIISANNADHSRFRGALSHAFSAKGLKSQEPILRGYVDKLVQRLEEVASSPNPVTDMVKWYNLTTFDLIGDLAFGEPFGGLDSSEYHYWVANIFQAVRGMAFVKLRDAYPLLFRALSLFLSPKSLMEARKRQIEYSSLTLRKRLQRALHRGPVDFVDSMLRHSGHKENKLTDKEMEANANILVIAGSETTATLLSGVTYWLLRTPDALRKVTREVRSSITSDSEITFQTTSQLPYMLACLKETLRIYPPAPGGLERITISPSVTISGHNIPPGVCPPLQSV